MSEARLRQRTSGWRARVPRALQGGGGAGGAAPPARGFELVGEQERLASGRGAGVEDEAGPGGETRDELRALVLDVDHALRSELRYAAASGFPRAGHGGGPRGGARGGGPRPGGRRGAGGGG